MKRSARKYDKYNSDFKKQREGHEEGLGYQPGIAAAAAKKELTGGCRAYSKRDTEATTVMPLLPSFILYLNGSSGCKNRGMHNAWEE